MNEEELQQKGVSTHAGFPNAAVGSQARSLDLSRLIIKHPSATFLMKLDSSIWEGLGMFAGDIIVIDRSLEARPRDTVIWWEHDEFIMGSRRNVLKGVAVWGIVLSVIHNLRN